MEKRNNSEINDDVIISRDVIDQNGVIEQNSITRHNDVLDETSPLLSLQDYPANRTDSGSDVSVRTNPRVGITCRRAMVLPLFVCYCLAGGIFMYEVPQYTHYRMEQKYKYHGDNTSRDTELAHAHTSDFGHQLNKNGCHVSSSTTNDVQRDTAVWSMYYTLASFIPAMFANLVWSSYSDILGRRFALLICCFGTTVRLGIFVLVIYFNLSLVYMVVGAVIDGVCGAFMVLFAALYAYISDITLPGKQRTIAIVTVELVLGLSFTVSSFTSGYIFTGGGYLYPALGCFCVDVFGFIILLFFVPETRPRENTRERSRNVLKVIAESFKFYYACAGRGTRLRYGLLVCGLVFVDIPATGRSTMEMLYQLGEPFCWGAKKIGYFGSIKSVIASVSSMCGACLFRRCLADDTIATLSIYINGVSYIVESIAATDPVLYIVPVLACLSNLPLPMIRSLLSSLTPADKQGVLMAGIGIISGVCALIGSFSNTTVYSATLSVMNGFVFLLMAFLTFIGGTFLLSFRCVNRRLTNQERAYNATI